MCDLESHDFYMPNTHGNRMLSPSPHGPPRWLGLASRCGAGNHRFGLHVATASHS